LSGLYNLGSGYWYWDFSPLEKRIKIMQNLFRHFVICPNKICIADVVKTKIHKNFKHKVTRTKIESPNRPYALQLPPKVSLEEGNMHMDSTCRLLEERYVKAYLSKSF
jgi:hypothetical protein